MAAGEEQFAYALALSRQASRLPLWGSFSEVGQRPGQVRSCLNSGHAATAAACPYPVKLKRPPT